MQTAEARRAVGAARSIALELGLSVEEEVVLNNSNRLVVHLMPCNAVARVTPLAHHPGHHASPEREVELVTRLAQADAPVATVDSRVEPRVFARDSFRVTMWTYFEPKLSGALSPAEYGHALECLHAGLRQIDLAAPDVMDRVAAVQGDLASREITPDIPDVDRRFLAKTLLELRQSILRRSPPEQLLHGEPHPGNVLNTETGARFIDFENSCRGPVEYDLGWVPKAVTDRYPGVDLALVDDCRGLVLAMVAAYRWRRDDQHPSGRESARTLLDVLRDGPPWPDV